MQNDFSRNRLAEIRAKIETIISKKLKSRGRAKVQSCAHLAFSVI
jgi:hypothetical protein